MAVWRSELTSTTPYTRNRSRRISEPPAPAAERGISAAGDESVGGEGCRVMGVVLGGSGRGAQSFSPDDAPSLSAFSLR